ncbi:HSP20 family protein [Spinactinospora alkalitolerans]|uniref:HSP20 family protein n=1 Tax=Spinactinospora alkalitolerans TaxID=687207 RepID=A0A852U049_9ACTN|nr:Hsp20/alpha crystallin family protein [Spinactinospora alkalitolerans]NYE48917.1 HSP20 family protein [Spinactinospora alkalitolerans]
MAARRKRGNPFHGVMDMMSEMNRISDHMSSMDSATQTQPRGFADAWSPTTDIFARGTDLVVRSELPGVGSDDVDVTFSHGTLTISGERRRDDEGIVYYASERFWGAFRREIILPEGTGEEDVEANFDEGLLEITVRGAAEAAGPKRIRVRSKKRSEG